MIMAGTCNQDNCTVAETDTCLLGNDPKTCPHRTASASVEAQIEPPLSEPAKRPRFPLSLTLTPDLTREMMGGRYCHVVGIVGAPDAGKTAALVSTYLLTSRGRLSGFEYADSRSLRAFDEISQGARHWNEGKLPDQLTVHTELADDRTAGFLHLRLRPAAGADSVDLLLPDIPGEWTTALVDSSRVDRLQFLKRADVIWLMVDGLQFAKPATRQLALHRTKLTMQRLAALLDPSPPVILVTTRRDKAASVGPDVVEALKAEAISRGIDLEFLEIASFADVGETTAGAGIPELIAASIRRPGSSSPDFWPAPSRAAATESRAMMRYRNPETDR